MSKKEYIEFARVFGLALRNDWTVAQVIDLESILIADNDRFNSARFRAYIASVRDGKGGRDVL